MDEEAITDYRGTFSWYELMSSNADAESTFYTSLFGWKPTDAGNPAMKYTILNVGERGVAGVFAAPSEQCAAGASAWSGFITVDDVDGIAARIAVLGGKVVQPPADIPGVGRFSRVTDPQGAQFLIFKPIPPATGVPAPLPPTTHGKFEWHELYTTSWEQVWPFYAELFGWTKGTLVDMGPMGRTRSSSRRRATTSAA